MMKRSNQALPREGSINTPPMDKEISTEREKPDKKPCNNPRPLSHRGRLANQRDSSPRAQKVALHLGRNRHIRQKVSTESRGINCDRDKEAGTEQKRYKPTSKVSRFSYRLNHAWRLAIPARSGPWKTDRHRAASRRNNPESGHNPWL